MSYAAAAAKGPQQTEDEVSLLIPSGIAVLCQKAFYYNNSSLEAADWRPPRSAPQHLLKLNTAKQHLPRLSSTSTPTVYTPSPQISPPSPSKPPLNPTVLTKNSKPPKHEPRKITPSPKEKPKRRSRRLLAVWKRIAITQCLLETQSLLLDWVLGWDLVHIGNMLQVIWLGRLWEFGLAS